MTRHICAAAVGIAMMVFGGTANADTLNSVARGWYDISGFHSSSNDNYVSGTQVQPAQTWRDFFTFNLSGVSGTITAAQLVLLNPSNGADGSGSYTVYDVSTPASTLDTSNSGPTGIAIFTDLGTGNAYGSYNYSVADNGKFVTINLDSQFLADINNRTSNLFSVGGNAVGGTFLFGNSSTGNPSDGNTRLTLTTVATPLPSSSAGFMVLAAGLGLVKFRRDTIRAGASGK